MSWYFRDYEVEDALGKSDPVAYLVKRAALSLRGWSDWFEHVMTVSRRSVAVWAAGKNVSVDLPDRVFSVSELATRALHEYRQPSLFHVDNETAPLEEVGWCLGIG